MRVDPATLRDLEFLQTNASATGIFDHLDFTQTHQGRKGAQCKTSLFLIASHLTEVAQDLENVPEFSCAYFGAELQDGEPVYDYALRTGVSSQRLGLWVIEKMGLLAQLQELRETNGARRG